MPTHLHAIVWIDHAQAKVFHVGRSGSDEAILHPHLPAKHLHHKAGTIGSGHAAPDKGFLAEVMNAVSDASEILIIGPAGAKTELARFLREQPSKIGERIVAVETADHPSDREIAAYAKQYFGVAATRAGAAN